MTIYSIVSLWVEYFKTNGNESENPVLFLSSNVLKNMIIQIILVQMTLFYVFKPLDMHGKQVVCMDSTHGTDIYDFYLITVLFLDEFHEDIPAGWIISSMKMLQQIRQCLLKMREKCGDISTENFMSDDANNFFNAWKSAFTTSKN